jgi:hypothetical protein
MPKSRYITVAEAQEMSGLSRQRLLQLLATRRIKGQKRSPRLWLIRELDLKAYLEGPRKPGPKVGFRWKKKKKGGSNA